VQINDDDDKVRKGAAKRQLRLFARLVALIIWSIFMDGVKKIRYNIVVYWHALKNLMSAITRKKTKSNEKLKAERDVL